VGPMTDRSRLAAGLRALRLRSGLSGQALGQALGWSQSKVSKLEQGTRGASPADVAAWAEAVSATAQERAELVALAQTVATGRRSWWESHSAGLTGRQHELAKAEALATRIMNFHPLLIPALLQPDAYARRVLELANVTGEADVAQATAARVQRQAVLYKGTQCDFIIPEAALRCRISDDPAIPLAVADRLISAASMPTVGLAILPLDAALPVLPVCGFGIFEIPGEPFAIVETLTDETILTGARELRIYREAFAALWQVACTGSEARDLVRHATGV